MANKFIKVDYDKFEDKRKTTMNYPYVLWYNAKPIEHGNTDREKRNAVMRDDFPEYICAEITHMSLPEEDSLFIDIRTCLHGYCTLSSRGYFVLSRGYFVININGVENIRLEPEEIYYNSDFDNHRHREACCYEINQEILQKICVAKSVDFKISGDRDLSSVVVNANEFITYARRFYNGFYDENAYLDSLNESEEEKEKEVNTSCLVTLLMAFAAISSFVACLSLLVGLFV